MVSGTCFRCWTTLIKKPIYAIERDSERVTKLRDDFAAQQPALNSARLIFLDESGMRLGSTTRYGWAQRGVKAFGKAQGSWKMVTMIGAVGLDGFRGFANIESGTTGDVYRAFVNQQLVPKLRPGDCVIQDNLASHKDARAIAAIEAAGATVIFLPPYSPEFNPIEKVWSKMKEYLRRCATLTREAFDNAVAAAMAAITTADLHGWYKHCGYTVTSV